MGVTIGYPGLQPDEDIRTESLAWARSFAADMEWAVEEIDVERPRGSLGHRVLEVPRIGGLSLLPHFACEPVPLLFLETTGHLIDSILLDEGEGDITLQDEALVKTHFAGPVIHAEICQFLAQLRQQFIPDLYVDDETGFFETGDTDRLNRAFNESWGGILEAVAELRDEPGSIFEIGGIAVRVPAEDRPAGTDAQLPSDHKNLLDELETWLMTRYGGFGLDFNRSAESVEHLDLLMLEADREGWCDDPEDEETERLAYAMGATFGRTVAATIGGQWEVDENEGLMLTEVGGVGMMLNPFEVAAHRIAHGPAFSFEYQYKTYRDLAARLRVRDQE